MFDGLCIIVIAGAIIIGLACYPSLFENKQVKLVIVVVDPQYRVVDIYRNYGGNLPRTPMENEVMRQECKSAQRSNPGKHVLMVKYFGVDDFPHPGKTIELAEEIGAYRVKQA